jgi:hypothetical protein
VGSTEAAEPEVEFELERGEAEPEVIVLPY